MKTRNELLATEGVKGVITVEIRPHPTTPAKKFVWPFADKLPSRAPRGRVIQPVRIMDALIDEEDKTLMFGSLLKYQG